MFHSPMTQAAFKSNVSRLAIGLTLYALRVFEGAGRARIMGDMDFVMDGTRIAPYTPGPRHP